MRAGQTVALLLLAVATASTGGCMATPQSSTGTVFAIEPRVCVTAETGAEYCFDTLTVERKLPGLQVGDCVVFSHTPPKSPGGNYRLEEMTDCDGAG